ncbi:MAG TPA: heavy-metal-associated domain-containing protein [Nitrospinaceae bacterium]|nr:heavy-metal-associated domain-containing protein [Nitrospinaceae bacterium]
MSKKTLIIAVVGLLMGWLLVTSVSGADKVVDPDVEVLIPGMVCPSCALGIKIGLRKTKLVKNLQINTKKEILLIEYWGPEIHPSEIRKIVKSAGYKVKSIKWLKKKEPSRYNKP